MSEQLAFDIVPANSPTWDTVTREQRPQYERCPDCDSMAYRMYDDARRVYKVLGRGWLTICACRCGRYAWRHYYSGYASDQSFAVPL